MTNSLIKTGGSTVLLGKFQYEGYFGYKEDKLLKVTKVAPDHDEYKNLQIVRTVKDYQKYFIIPDEDIIKLLPESEFYNFLKVLLKNHDIDIFDGCLYCSYVNYGGSMDVMDSLVSFSPRVWRSAKSILRFSYHIMNGLKFLHEKEIAHLDIKPENIVVDLWNLKFKIIDFGYSSKYPFDDFVNDIRGTPCYFPRDLIVGSDLGLPRIDANDVIEIDGKIPMQIDRTLVYKIDSYCLGRTIKLILDVYKTNTNRIFENISKRKITNLLQLLLQKDVFRRLTVSQILSLK